MSSIHESPHRERHVGIIGNNSGSSCTNNNIQQTAQKTLITLIFVTIAAIAFGIWGRWGAPVDRTTIRSIAVLTLENQMK